MWGEHYWVWFGSPDTVKLFLYIMRLNPTLILEHGEYIE